MSAVVYQVNRGIQHSGKDEFLFAKDIHMIIGSWMVASTKTLKFMSTAVFQNRKLVFKQTKTSIF